MAFTPIDPTKAEVRITGTGPDYGLDFYIPRGERGDVGPTGPQGPAVPTNMAIGTIEIGPAAPGTVGPQGPTGLKGDPGGWVTGTSLGTADLNTITTDGIYRQNTGSNATLALNYPQAGVLGVLYVTQASTSSWMMQEFHMNGTPNQARAFYVRVNAGGTWQPWRAYYSNRIDQTAGRAIYHWDDINGREQLIYGDTGWRDISQNSETGKVLIRRANSMVELKFRGSVSTSGGNVAYTAILPVGFRPTQSHEVPFREGSSAYGSTKMATLDPATGTVTFWGVAATSTQLTLQNLYGTTDAWPTTLPGTASGSIPNV